MFAFCTRFLGYSEAEAHIRIQAMRLMKVMPVVEEKIKSGEISLSVAAQAQSHFRREDLKRKVEQKPKLSLAEKESVLQELNGTSTREAERKLLSLSNEEKPLPREKLKPLSTEH